MVPRGQYNWDGNYFGWDPLEKRYMEFESYSAYIEWWQDNFKDSDKDKGDVSMTDINKKDDSLAYMDKAVDVWSHCFFGYVDDSSRRMCAYADTLFDCKEGCECFLTKREANKICRTHIAEKNSGGSSIHE